MFKLLVFVMLSTASGWGLPSNDSPLLSNESTNIMDGVDSARDRRQLGCVCDHGCNEDCDGIFWGGCDGSCTRSCDDWSNFPMVKCIAA